MTSLAGQVTKLNEAVLSFFLVGGTPAPVGAAVTACTQPTPAPGSLFSTGPSDRPYGPSWTPGFSLLKGALWAHPTAKANRTAWDRPASQGLFLFKQNKPYQISIL